MDILLVYTLYATHGAASGSTPSNCTTEPRYSKKCCCTVASRGARARATTTRCAEPTKGSWLAASIGESTIAPTTRFPIWTPIKTGSESIEATLRRRWILFAGFVARMEDARLPKCVMFGELVGGAGCVRGQ